MAPPASSMLLPPPSPPIMALPELSPLSSPSARSGRCGVASASASRAAAAARHDDAAAVPTCIVVTAMPRTDVRGRGRKQEGRDKGHEAERSTRTKTRKEIFGSVADIQAPWSSSHKKKDSSDDAKTKTMTAKKTTAAAEAEAKFKVKAKVGISFARPSPSLHSRQKSPTSVLEAAEGAFFSETRHCGDGNGDDGDYDCDCDCDCDYDGDYDCDDDCAYDARDAHNYYRHQRPNCYDKYDATYGGDESYAVEDDDDDDDDDDEDDGDDDDDCYFYDDQGRGREGGVHNDKDDDEDDDDEVGRARDGHRRRDYPSSHPRQRTHPLLRNGICLERRRRIEEVEEDAIAATPAVSSRPPESTPRAVVAAASAALAMDRALARLSGDEDLGGRASAHRQARRVGAALGRRHRRSSTDPALLSSSSRPPPPLTRNLDRRVTWLDADGASADRGGRGMALAKAEAGAGAGSGSGRVPYADATDYCRHGADHADLRFCVRLHPTSSSMGREVGGGGDTGKRGDRLRVRWERDDRQCDRSDGRRVREHDDHHDGCDAQLWDLRRRLEHYLAINRGGAGGPDRDRSCDGVHVRIPVPSACHPRVGLLYDQIGTHHFLRGEYKAASDSYHRALEAYRSSMGAVAQRGGDANEKSCSVALGKGSASESTSPSSPPPPSKSLPESFGRIVKSRLAVAKTLGNLAAVHWRTGRTGSAVAYLEQAMLVQKGVATKVRRREEEKDRKRERRRDGEGAAAVATLATTTTMATKKKDGGRGRDHIDDDDDDHYLGGDDDKEIDAVVGGGEGSIELARTLHRLGIALHALERYGRSERSLLRSARLFERSHHGPFHADVASARASLGRLYASRRRHGDALRCYVLSHRVRCAILNDGHPSLLSSAMGVASSLTALERYSEAEGVLGEVLDGQSEALVRSPDEEYRRVMAGLVGRTLRTMGDVRRERMERDCCDGCVREEEGEEEGDTITEPKARGASAEHGTEYEGDEDACTLSFSLSEEDDDDEGKSSVLRDNRYSKFKRGAQGPSEMRDGLKAGTVGMLRDWVRPHTLVRSQRTR